MKYTRKMFGWYVTEEEKDFSYVGFSDILGTIFWGLVALVVFIAVMNLIGWILIQICE